MSKTLFQRLGLMAATAITAVALVACGGDSSAPAKKVATSDLGITIAAGTTQEAAIISALKAAPYTFTNNLVIGGVTYQQPVKITVTGTTLADLKYSLEDSSTPKMTLTNEALAFGSCIFKVAGQPDTPFNPCTLNVALKGKTFTPGGPFTARITWLLATNFASSIDETVSISADGQVTIGGIFVGTVPVSDVTGATGT
jgi:hypothetical protein